MNNLKNSNNKIESIIKEELKSTYDIMFYDEVCSTNTVLKEFAEKQFKEGTIVIARRQTHGRGTQGRKFYSPENGLYMSMLIRPNSDISQSSLLTVATAVAVVQAIKSVTRKKCKIKWVNDIFYKDKKVGGILTESSYNNKTNSLNYAVIGIGLNLFDSCGGFPEDLRNIAGTIMGKNVSNIIYAKLVTKIIKNSFNLYKSLEKRRYLKFYRKLSFLNHKEICYLYNNQLHLAKVVGIDNNARLIVKENGQKSTLLAGEVLFKSKN